MLRWRLLHPVCLIIFLMTPHLSAGASPYKWTDSQGRVHYGDRPPPDQTVEAVKVPLPPSPENVAKPLTQMGSEATEPATDSAPQHEVPPSPASSKQLMQENCNIAKRNLEILTTSGRRIHVVGADGKPVVLDEKERELKLSETRQQIEKFCQ